MNYRYILVYHSPPPQRHKRISAPRFEASSLLSLDFSSTFFTDFGISILLFSCGLTFSFPLTLAVGHAISVGQEPELFMVFSFWQPSWAGGCGRISGAQLGLSSSMPWADGFPSTCLVAAGKFQQGQNFSCTTPRGDLAARRSEPSTAPPGHTCCAAEQGLAQPVSSYPFKGWNQEFFLGFVHF